ncbi:hypothetical protein [Vibrio sp. 10N.239.312.D08]|uniref:hypothetical protein n=1 Tax=Vibrio sp. 10N.239.312.D08 TaxID=3229978 RepID=UPI003553A24D
MTTTIELVRKWQIQEVPKVDLLALSECSDALTVTPNEIAGEFWVFVQTSNPHTQLQKLIPESTSLVMQLKQGEDLVAMIQLRPAEFKELGKG